MFGEKYDKICKIGSGGFGEVWLVKEKLTGVYFALKLLRADRQQELSGLQRYRTAVSGNPELLQIYDIGMSDGSIYYTMELADNLSIRDISEEYVPDTLAGRIADSGRLRYDEIVWCLYHLLPGVEALHNAGFAHCDIKPCNIIFVGGEPKLADIGLLDSVTSNHSGGTPGYIHPASCDGDTPTSAQENDFYALGMVLLNMLGIKSLEESLPELTDEEKRLRDFCFSVCDPGQAPVATVREFRERLVQHGIEEPCEVIPVAPAPSLSHRIFHKVRTHPLHVIAMLLLLAIAGWVLQQEYSKYRLTRQGHEAGQQIADELKRITEGIRKETQKMRADMQEMASRQAASTSKTGRQSTPSTRINSYFSPDGESEKAMLREITKAKSSIQVAVYFFTESDYADALVAAKKRGVDIQVVLDRTQQNRKDSQVGKLITAGIPVYIDRSHRIMHNKFAVIDNDTVITGSQNWTDSSDKVNAENTLVIHNNRYLAKKYQKKFDELKSQGQRYMRKLTH